MAKLRWVLFSLLLMVGAFPSLAKDPFNSAQLNQGLAAFQSGNLATAIDAFIPSAMLGCAQAMHNMGHVAALLSEAAPEPDKQKFRIDSYLWLTLAAKYHSLGSDRTNSLQNRDAVVIQYKLTPEEIGEGERLAKEWQPGQPLPAKKPLATSNIGTFEAAGDAFTRGDHQTALKIWRAYAENGYAPAQFNIAVVYRDGHGVEQNYTEAARWYLLAAEQGHAFAQSDLGFLYLNGLGVNADYGKALTWLRLAALQGDAQAQHNFGIALFQHSKDEVHAYMWIYLAAEQGHAEAIKVRDLATTGLASEIISQAKDAAWRCKESNYSQCD
jgi:hypothetical protein